MNARLIYLARHAEYDHPEDVGFVGQRDLPLNEAGIRQAQGLARGMRETHLTAIWCSDLQRSRRTAEIVAEGRSMVPRALRELREITHGQWEGLTSEEVRRRFPQDWARWQTERTSFRGPGAESFEDVRQRVIPAFEGVVAGSTGDVLIVAHMGVNRAILSHVLDMPLRSIFRLSQDYACLNVIALGEAGYTLQLMNRVYDPAGV